MEIAEKFLKSAEKTFDIDEYDMCIIAAYDTLFHCCRALLFSNSYIERSHYCLIVAVRHIYKDDKQLLNFLNSVDKVRISRHELQYGGEFSNKEEAEFVLDLAGDFIKYVKKKLRVSA